MMKFNEEEVKQWVPSPSFVWDLPLDESTPTAKVMRKELIDDKFRVQCPVDLSEWEIEYGAKKWRCSIHDGVVKIE